MSVVPPVKQYQSKYTLKTFLTKLSKIFFAFVGRSTINVIVPSKFMEQGVQINNLSEWQDVPCVDDGSKVCGRATEIEITAFGAYHLTHTDPSARFAAMLYWNGYRGGHGYTGAYGLRPIACTYVYAIVWVHVYVSSTFIVPQVTLTSASYAVYEDGGEAIIGLTRSGDLSLPAVVSVETADDEAVGRLRVHGIHYFSLSVLFIILLPPSLLSCLSHTLFPSCLPSPPFLPPSLIPPIAGRDYTATKLSVEFKPGETQKILSVPVIDDVFPEQNKTFFIFFASSPDVYLSPITFASVTILNDDPPLPGVIHNMFLCMNYLML